MTAATLLESVMLICFGISWPLSISKAIRTKKVEGKSLLFMSVIFIGYLCGIASKLIATPSWIIGLYALNAVMVAFDMSLYLRYSKKTDGAT